MWKERVAVDPNLVCKITVQKTNGDIAVGSGYPIARNRIITAAHVIVEAMPVADSAAEKRRIILP